MDPAVFPVDNPPDPNVGRACTFFPGGGEDGQLALAVAVESDGLYLLLVARDPYACSWEAEIKVYPFDDEVPHDLTYARWREDG